MPDLKIRYLPAWLASQLKSSLLRLRCPHCARQRSYADARLHRRRRGSIGGSDQADLQGDRQLAFAGMGPGRRIGR